MTATDGGLDEAGFIRQVPRVPFQAEYRAVLAAVRRQLPALLGVHLVALYVYGSVAEGRARPGRSDLDLTLILSDAARLKPCRRWSSSGGCWSTSIPPSARSISTSVAGPRR